MTIQATSWTNGSPNYKTGAGFGLRIKSNDLNKFDEHINDVCLILEGEIDPITVNIKKNSFRNGCGELISKEIGEWFIKNNYDKWQKGRTFKFEITHIVSNGFRVKRITV